MSYLLENETKNITVDIVKRKEFYKYKIDKESNPETGNSHKKFNLIPRFFIEKMIRNNNILQFASYQMFINNYINPNTTYSRLLLKHETGTGKTIGSLSIALNFINYYTKESSDNLNIGSIFIMGFTANQFKTELLRFPEFGFISRIELRKLKLLKKQSYSGIKNDLEKLQEFMVKIRKRFNNRIGNGFFQFKGYKKLVNELFIIKDITINLSLLNEDEILNYINTGKITLNTPLLNQFKNSLVICDEIHNTYNSQDKNNWGIALQYVLNSDTSIRSVFLSATPINNNPSEIVDLLNLLLPHNYYPNKLYKNDMFDSENKLKKNSLEKIANLCQGRISYLRDINPLNFPSKKFIGESIPGSVYLKFIRCPMSNFHYNTYKSVFDGTLPHEGQYLVDFAIPNPNDSNLGLYQTNDIKKELSGASQKWKDENKINFSKNVITGSALNISNLNKISNKYYEMIKLILSMISNKCGKIFVYHNNIQMSGVLFIQQIMLENNIIGEYDNSTDNTLCSICGNTRKLHTKEQTGGGIKKHIKKTSTDSHDNLHTVEYNLKSKLYKLFVDNNNFPILEYKIVDNFFVILEPFINYKNYSILQICSAINKLMTNNSIIIESNSINEELRKLIDILGFHSISNKYINDKLYHTNIRIDKSNKNDLIKKINKKLSKTSSSDTKRGGVDTKSNNNHDFIPVRYIVAHSMIAKNNMMQSIEKYNSPDNYDGGRIMILIGGRVIKEAFDIKAVRNVLVMGRPDNIPTLIQILGRAVRKNSHALLPLEHRNVNIRIFTSCLPIKNKTTKQYELSHEETKYVEKLTHYKVIQDIEKTMHENAIDALINKDIIWSKKERNFYKSNKNHKELGSLYFEPNLSKKILDKKFTLDELNLNTFNAFYADHEINHIILIIKRLFIEKSVVWNYKDLLYAVKSSKKWFNVEFNTELIDEKLFIVALSRLIWINDNKYVEPVIKHVNKQINNVIEQLFDYDDKLVLLPGGHRFIITQIDSFYTLLPLDDVENKPIIDAELPYRLTKDSYTHTINIKSYLENEQNLTYFSDKHTRFFIKWNNVPIEKLEMAVCDFGIDFHSKFLEECIEYVFNIWTNPDIKKSSKHAFYFKMLNYYDLRKLIVWGHTAKSYIYKKYTQYLIPVDIKLNDKSMSLNDIKPVSKIESSGLLNLLKSSINKSDLNWISSGLKQQFDSSLSESLKLFDGNYKKKGSSYRKTNSNNVPLGHLLNYIPKFYHPNSGWSENPEYLDNLQKFVESNLIVGYDERSSTGVHIRFKIRNSIQNIKQFKDSRLIEKGTVCTSKSKIYLKEISNKLGIKIAKKNNVVNLCNAIRTKLIYLELKARTANTNIKWFYFIYERRPETSIK
jgi:hypothetical protein